MSKAWPVEISYLKLLRSHWSTLAKPGHSNARKGSLPLVTLLAYFLRAEGELIPLGSLGEELVLDAADLATTGRTLRRTETRAVGLNGWKIIMRIWM